MANTAKTSNTVAISKRTKGKLPSLPFETIKDAVLGQSYELSLVFAGDTLTKRLNKTYRGKDTVPNILSFPLSETEGELFINPHKVKKEKKAFALSLP